MVSWTIPHVILVISLAAATNSQDSGCGTPRYQRGTSGNFSSMNYPNNYVRGANCVWHITASAEYRIRLHFNESFNVLGMSDCWKAGVEFTQPSKKYAGPYCDTSAPPPDFFTLSNSVTIKFTTNAQGTPGKGFSITWTAFSATMESGCGGPKYLFGQSGAISSMNYPKHYHRWASCHWVITVPIGNRVKLQFNSNFNLERKPNGACADDVTVYTGAAATLCGTSAPGVVESNTNKVTVNFFSDSSNQRAGFSLTWTAVAVVQGGCGNSSQTGLSGSFSSMNYPNKYTANANCVWSISVAKGYRIRLHFSQPFALEQGDTVTVYEESLASITYGPYSGSTAPPDILSYDNDVIVSFKSNVANHGAGFNITWTAVAEGRKTFGPNDEYTCHCNLNVQCNSSGACPNQECDQGWYGEYCQTGNAAVGRPAAQSSTYKTRTAAEKAVDNYRNQLMSGGSCTLTAELPLDNQPWWRVDLGDRFALLNLTIYNRGNDGCQSYTSCRDRLKNFIVWMTDVDDPDQSKGNVCVTHPGIVQLAAKPQLTCGTPAVGRYLYIKLLDNSTALSLCEVVIDAFQYKVLGAPNPFEIVEAAEKSFKIRWAPPRSPIGNLTAYKLSCTPLFSYDNAVNDNKDKYTVGSEPAANSKEANLKGLQQATKYNCSISALTSNGYGPTVSVLNWTKPERAEIPAKWISSVSVTAWSATTINLDIKEVPKVLRSGEVKAVRVGVKITSAESLRGRQKRAATLSDEEHEQLTGYEEAKENGYTSYIAAELAADFKGAFVIGDGTTRGSYQNPPLVTGETYDVLYGLVTKAGMFTTVSFISMGESITVRAVNIGVAVGVPIAIIIILVAVIVPVVFIIRKRRNSRNDRTDGVELPTRMETCSNSVDGSRVDVGIDTPLPIPVAEPEPKPVDVHERPDRSILCSDILKHNKMMKSNDSAGFAEEFKGLPTYLVRPCTIGQLQKNKKQNRYRNIIAYDHSRVILKPIGEDTNDYINANYINGYDKKKVFIASQGPMDYNITDMWRMIWQEGCTAIVMLTNIREQGRVKCAQYWPSTGSATHGPFKIDLKREDVFSDYVKRTMRISLDRVSRMVTHYHFIVWPDHGVPLLGSALLNLRATVMKDYRENYGKIPIVVHCSAGVGRTGTLIAIDYLIRQGIAEKKVNVFDCVLKLRNQRPDMVQNADQYEHIYDAMSEYFELGTTKIPSEVFPEQYKDLIKIVTGQSMCKLQKQYTLLATFAGVKKVDIKADAAREHSDKNRYQDIIPAESSRPMLSLPVNGWDNYINAVYLTGFGSKDYYIATQMPLPHTVKDIWRLVDDTGLSTIVMMNTVKEDDELAPVYWPKESEKVTYGPLVIEGKQVDTSHSVIAIRDFQFSRVANSRGTGEKPARPVRHFHLQNWPDDQATPDSPKSIVDLLGKVERWQQGIKNKQILVQCMDGASQSGVFCAAHSVIEKVKIDHEVDVPQYVRLLRINRPQLINTYEQFKFVHDVALQYLSQYDTYANFN